MEEDKTILYDILEPYVWPVHTEIIPGEVPRSVWKSLATTAKGCVHYGVQKMVHSLRSIPPLSVCQLLTDTISWKIALSSDGDLLAVLQENHVELRCLDDEFVVAIAKCGVSVDSHPQWRKMVWNEDSTCLAIVNSSGEVFVISKNGQRLCHIDNKASEEKDLSQAAAGLSFMPVSSQQASSSVAQLIVTSTSGLLSCYIIKSSGQYSLLHTFSFMSYYPYGVGSVLYQPQHHIIIVAAVSSAADEVSLSKWRILDSAPHYAMIEGGELVKKSSSILPSFGQLLPYQQPSNHDQSWVFNMELSPSGSVLATLDVSGNISLYDVPSLRLRKQWSIEEQYNALKEDTLLSGSPNKNDLPHPFDISWWSEQALVVVNNRGSLTVSNIKSFDNLLGASAEKCEPLVCLSSAHDSSLLFLECEQSTTSMTTPLESVTGSTESEDVSPAKRAIKHLLYSLTELERFQPPRKKPRVISRTYRLVCLKSTTPQELYRRKIDNEEYGDALQLARTYQLDCDLVYQRQWSTSSVSKATIEDYLSRVSKQHWVMSECLHRVTDDYNAMNDLLKYGLIRTGISEVVTDLSIEVTDIHLVEEVLRGIERLTDDQLFLVMCRIKILSYLDRLSLMQEILGGPVATDERFSGMDFHSFRDRSVVELAVDYAQQGDWKAVDLLFSYHGDHTLPHRLAILSNFPETISPEDYASLLPAVNTSGVLIPWEQRSWRDSCDWCELEVCKRLLPSEDEQKESSGEFVYQESPQMITYKSAADHDGISMWYHERAREIERLSGEVLNSLTLIEIAKDYGIKNTGVIRDDLLTLKCIVFERAVDNRMCLANLEKMSASEKLTLLMKEVEPDDFADCFQKYTTPFLQRQEMHHPGTSEQLLTDYLCVLAKDDLRPCLCIFKTAHTEHPAHPLLTDMVKLVQLILNCMYSCERTDQLSIADQIFECIPEEKDSDSADLVELHRKVDALDNHLHAVELLHQYEIEKPILYIKTIENDVDEAKKLMIRIARSASRRKPPLKESDWLKLTEQLLGLQRNIFTCLGENICYKIIAESLLSSGLHSNITLGGHLLAHSSQQHPDHSISSEDSAKRKTVSTFVCKISFKESVELVLSAAHEYFNSAGDSADHEMALARCCLDLIKEPVDDIVTECHLIEAMGILTTCQVTIIPVQVRLCEHKLDIVKEALQSNPALCRNATKVLTLAKLLGLQSADGGVETLTGDLGQAMILVVQTAMKHSECDVALEICHQLMSTPTPDAWQVCSELAADKVQDLQIRTGLLQFALTHCRTGEIKRILHILHTVETEDLYQQCTSTSSSDTRQQSGMLQMVGYNAVQQIVNKSTGIVQQLIKPDVQSGDSGKMSSYLNWMSSAATALNDFWRSTEPQLSPSSSSSSLSEGHHLNSSQLVQSYHPFYDDNLTASSNDYIVLRPMDWSSGTVKLNQAILRTTLLLADYSQSCGDVSETLLNMAQPCATTNLPLFLAYLLALPDPMMVKPLFQRLEPNMLTLHVAIYYVCLQISVLVNKCDSSLYLLPPATVVAHVTSHMTGDHADWPEKAKELVEFLKELSTQLGDLMQGRTLQEFDLDIDVERFTQNTTYKRQVILMLVRNINSTYFSTGMKLAAQYEVPKWEVLMEHLDWLLTESKLTNQMMQNHISQIGVYDVALQKPQETVDHLMKVVYPRIAGTDHNSLLVCLSLMEKCVSRDAKDTQLVDISTQIKLLKKFKTSLQAVDFKAVMCGQNPLMAFQPHLTSENVHVVSKVATKIPLSSGGHLQASDIFKTFAEKLFWDTHPNKEKNNTEDVDWLHRYQCCQEYLERLSTTEYEAIIKNITISPMALKLIPADVRTQLVRECIKFGRSKSCKIDGLEVKLQQLMQHLKIVNDKMLSPLANKEEWRSLYEEFAMTNSEIDKVHTVVIKMLMAGLDQQLIDDILTLTNSVVPHSLQISSLVREALETSLSQLSQDKSPNKEGLLAISNILRTCQKSQDDTLTVLDILSDYYKSPDHSADSRIAILELIEQINALPPEDIVQYKTETILYDQFDVKINHGHMTSCDDRQSLVEQLLTQAVNMDQLLTIVKLLQLWPDPIAAHVVSWGDLLVQLSLQPDGRGYALLVRAGLEGIPLEADIKLYENLSNDFPMAFKVAVMSRHETLLHRAMEDATVHFKELGSDYDVLELVIWCGQIHCIVNSPLYSSFHRYLLTDSPNGDNLTLPLFAALLHCPEEEVKQTLKLHQPMDRVRTVAEQLYNHSYWLEAGALLLRSHRTHPALVTTANAVAMLHKLFKK